jgi:hypothetical protein
MRNAIFSVIAVLICAGCAGAVRTAPGQSDNKNVPPDRILAFQEKKPGTARVVITRDEGLLGSGCYLGVKAGETVLGRFDVGETAEFYLPPGGIDMAVVPDPDGKALCGAGPVVVERQSVNAETINRFRISLGMFRRPRLLPVAN